jgi:excisionase family DNA binding protein
MSISKESTVLTSWKEIARYLGKGVRTVQRWEQEFGLPVRRPIGALQKSAVLLHREEVDAWLATRFSARSMASVEVNHEHRTQPQARFALRESMRQASELRLAHRALTIQISESIRLLAERCDRLTTQSRQSPWRPAVPNAAVSLVAPPPPNTTVIASDHSV